MSDREEILLDSGFVLHHRPFRNTSRIVECLTVRGGRTGLVAHGSRRRGKPQSALLQPFVPLRLSWIRRGELGTLTHVEAGARQPELTGEHLLAGFYVNELCLRLLARGDPNPLAYDAYGACIAGLAARDGGVSRPLRLFELSLLHALGYGLALDCDVDTGEPLRPELRYSYEPESGPRRANGSAPEAGTYSGTQLISLRERALDDAESLGAAKRLLRRVLATYLGEKPLKSRSVFEDIASRGLRR